MDTKKLLLAIPVMLLSLSFSACDQGHEKDLPQPVEVKKYDKTGGLDPIADDRDDNNETINDGKK